MNGRQCSCKTKVYCGGRRACMTRFVCQTQAKHKREKILSLLAGVSFPLVPARGWWWLQWRISIVFVAENRRGLVFGLLGIVVFFCLCLFICIHDGWVIFLDFTYPSMPSITFKRVLITSVIVIVIALVAHKTTNTSVNQKNPLSKLFSSVDTSLSIVASIMNWFGSVCICV